MIMTCSAEVGLWHEAKPVGFQPVFAGSCA
ncbi:hypothetical protein X744_05115 [Mesorhizobium sp. LNJC372A00]|nr:hypothetical protein X766_11195 [Mesorhizobium sp. LSJC255A00]ESX27312.1 hypothetical protein X767_04210 [Mesorhizobium sp. LSJC264A00]ESX28853.1 hypothetical protein X765_15285 [Mesorhizobium sp. LSHC440B00]ESX34936.1 hypothetical protein X763_20745 [Mesorhizobium sp. LSHC432A00]ESX42605.1 hypothetical protein X764_09060 [Mesorhizobium sp. LSHC440A00]ESX73507.1 hypothetical protein X757_20310 [Mesorhizobium sp. LSHC414A00]ESY06793.1 hypothetical protein X753_12490 [Mesorhizobium sp. LNJC3